MRELTSKYLESRNSIKGERRRQCNFHRGSHAAVVAPPPQLSLESSRCYTVTLLQPGCVSTSPSIHSWILISWKWLCCWQAREFYYDLFHFAENLDNAAAVYHRACNMSCYGWFWSYMIIHDLTDKRSLIIVISDHRTSDPWYKARVNWQCWILRWVDNPSEASLEGLWAFSITSTHSGDINHSLVPTFQNISKTFNISIQRFPVHKTFSTSAFLLQPASALFFFQQPALKLFQPSAQF